MGASGPLTQRPFSLQYVGQLSLCVFFGAAIALTLSTASCNVSTILLTPTMQITDFGPNAIADTLLLLPSTL